MAKASAGGSLRLLPLVALLVAAVAQQYGEYDYGYGYDFYNNEDDFGDDFGSSSKGSSSTGSSSSSSSSSTKGDDFYYDEYGYYGDEDEQYYEYYGYYADDFAGYEDYYSDDYDFFEECSVDASGKPVLSNSTASCDIKLTGVDKHADKLTGGLDGVYKLSSCYNGKAMYKRVDSPAGENRVLWYSSTFGDWDVSKGSDPNEAEILLYGGEMEHASVPLFVSSWHLGADLKSSSNLGAAEYLPINIKVECADGKKYDKETYNTKSQQTQRVGPALTDEEMEAKYRYIYDKYARADPSPTINFTFVVLLVMTGLTIVLAIPYFLLRKKGGKGGTSLATSFAQMLQQSKKKSSGHIN